MLNKPSFKACFRVESDDQGHVFLLSERASILLEGKSYQLLVPLIDGQHSVDQIVDLLQDRLAASEIYYALMHMAQQGYLVEAKDEPDNPALATFCQSLNVDLREAQHRLQTTTVAVRSIGTVPAQTLIVLLEALQVQVAKQGDLEVVITDDYLCVDLDAINRQLLNRSCPWLLVRPIGTIAWMGPLLHPGRTGCWQCLAQRIQANRPIEAFLQNRQSNSFPVPLEVLSSVQQIALNMVATEIFKWILTGKSELDGNLLTYDSFSLTTTSHVLVKQPQCPSCGNPDLEQPRPILLASQKKRFTVDGGHRCCSPEITFRQHRHHISPILGVIRELQKVAAPEPTDLIHTDLIHTDLIHTYIVKHPFTSMFDDIEALRQNLGGRSSGKGKTDAQAKVSGLGEALERYSGVFQGNEPRQQSSYQQLGEQAVHPNACMNFSDQQFKAAQIWNVLSPGHFHRIPSPFDQTRIIDWTPVWSLTSQSFKYLPTAYCYHGYPQPSDPDCYPDCWADSNGCAAGNSLEEAILQGFMELVERDCVAIWWYNRIPRPEVDLDRFQDPYFQNLKQYYQTLNRDLWVLDITNDFQIPAFAAISRRTDRAIEDIIYGFGAHFDPRIAISRALTEVSQNLASVRMTNADGSTRYPICSDPVILKWWKTATLENQPYLAPIANVIRQPDDYRYPLRDDLLADVRACQKLVEAKGLEMLVLDQTRPDIGLKVVKVIVPGMRHFWRRLGLGRLYDVPVELGWLSQPLPEDQLNPVPIWL